MQLSTCQHARLRASAKAHRSINRPATAVLAPRPSLRSRWLHSAAAATTVSTYDGPAPSLKQQEQAAGSVTEEASDSWESFSWLANWWPVAPLSHLDPLKPTSHTICNQDLVVWWSPQEGAFKAFKDRCPHRYAPLTQGRIVNGNLVCSYHGWEFNSTGACTKIPQLEPGAVHTAACASPRACVTTYPTREIDGLLYVWLDPSPQGLKLAAQRGVPLAPGSQEGKAQWGMQQPPNDALSWYEQMVDPSHANHLHKGLGGFEPSNVLPMTPVAVSAVHPTKGFTFKHVGYEVRNKGEHARYFVPPGAVITVSKMPFATVIMDARVVPVRPGECRTFLKFNYLPPGADVGEGFQMVGATDTTAQTAAETASPAGNTATRSAQQAAASGTNSSSSTKSSTSPQLPQRGVGGFWGLFKAWRNKKLPHYMIGFHAIVDQDIVIMHAQEHAMARSGLTPPDYAIMAPGADQGVVAMNRWLKRAGYPHAAFRTSSNPATAAPGSSRASSTNSSNTTVNTSSSSSSSSSAPSSRSSVAGTELPLERLLDRRRRHVDNCVICQEGERMATQAAAAASVLAAAAGIWGLLLAAAAVVQTGSILAAGPWSVASLCVAAAAAWVAIKVNDFKESTFVSGVRQWRRRGGLSLINMP